MSAAASIRVRAQRLGELHAGLIDLLAAKERELCAARGEEREVVRAELKELVGEAKLIVALLEKAGAAR